MEFLDGVFLPIVTPFLDGELDMESYVRLLRHYADAGISGVIPLGTTGEAPTIDEEESRTVIEATIETVGSRIPIYIGVSSNSTRKAVHWIEELNRYPVEGYLVTSPYYNLPSQAGIYDHFAALAESTDRHLLIYNIPYRTGRNVENETVFRLSEIENIVGIKDSCGNIAHTAELIRDRAHGFSVLTGEDALFYFNLAAGGNGGILASAHISTPQFLRIHELVRQNNHRAALDLWNPLSRMIPLFFKEPNPAPIKYLLAEMGLIRSAEVRAPLAPISDAPQGALREIVTAANP
ncbi:MAG TPA: 4-hydroxy-tetrahydrodipicolinate synthase [Spirochaetia bacterium]|nr:4-hydroxy-tetrahydrodipicolinate synthase [Spirochaetia bacterium]